MRDVVCDSQSTSKVCFKLDMSVYILFDNFWLMKKHVRFIKTIAQVLFYIDSYYIQYSIYIYPLGSRHLSDNIIFMYRTRISDKYHKLIISKIFTECMSLHVIKSIMVTLSCRIQIRSMWYASSKLNNRLRLKYPCESVTWMHVFIIGIL